MSEPKHMDIGEFVERGYLQEVNRQFFHPIGLALEVTKDDDGSYSLSGVWDYRDDPEGIYFTESPDVLKAANVGDELGAKGAVRYEKLGYIVQPLGDPDSEGRVDLDKQDLGDWKIIDKYGNEKEITAHSTIGWEHSVGGGVSWWGLDEGDHVYKGEELVFVASVEPVPEPQTEVVDPMLADIAAQSRIPIVEPEEDES